MNITPEYITGGLNSLATHLYLDTIATVGKTLRGELFIPGFVPSCCRYRLRHEPSDVLMHLIEQMLSTMRIEEHEAEPSAIGFEPTVPETTVSALSPSDLEHLQPIIFNSVADFTKKYSPFSNWLDPWNAQQYLQSYWGLRLTASAVQISQQFLRPWSPGLVRHPIAEGSTFDGYSQNSLTPVDVGLLWSSDMPVSASPDLVGYETVTPVA